MSRRISIPDDHVAVILPNDLADEAMTLCRLIRQLGNGRGSKSVRMNLAGMGEAAGNLLLAILEAKES